MSNFGPAPGVTAALPAQSVTPPQPEQVGQQDTRVMVGPCVISYPNVFVPRKKMNPKPEDPLQYSAEFLVYMPPGDQHQHAVATAVYQKLMTAANIASQAKFNKPADHPSFRNKCVRDLAERNGDNPPGFFFSARSMSKPQVLVGNPPLPCTDPAEIYPGAIVYVSVNAGTYDSEGNRGVKWYLNAILKVADGPRLAPERDATDDFKEVLAQMPLTNLPPQMAGIPQFAPQPAQHLQAQPLAPGMYDMMGQPIQQFAPAQPAQPGYHMGGYPAAQQFAPQQLPPGYGMPTMPGYPQQ